MTTPEPVSPAPDTEALRQRAVAVIERELELARSGEGYEANAVAEEIVRRYWPDVAGLRADLDQARAEVERLATLVLEKHELIQGWARYGERVKAERAKYGDMLISALGITGPVGRWFEHLVPAAVQEIERLRAELAGARTIPDDAAERVAEALRSYQLNIGPNTRDSIARGMSRVHLSGGERHDIGLIAAQALGLPTPTTDPAQQALTAADGRERQDVLAAFGCEVVMTGDCRYFTDRVHRCCVAPLGEAAHGTSSHPHSCMCDTQWATVPRPTTDPAPAAADGPKNLPPVVVDPDEANLYCANEPAAPQAPAEPPPCGQVHDGQVCTKPRVHDTNGCWGHYGPEIDPDASYACDAAKHVTGQVPCPHCVPIPGRPAAREDAATPPLPLHEQADLLTWRVVHVPPGTTDREDTDTPITPGWWLVGHGDDPDHPDVQVHLGDRLPTSSAATPAGGSHEVEVTVQDDGWATAECRTCTASIGESAEDTVQDWADRHRADTLRPGSLTPIQPEEA